MKDVGLKYGLICGLVYVAFSLVGIITGIQSQSSSNMMLNLLYTGVITIATFFVIYYGIKYYRDEVNEGLLSLGEAVKMGLFIALVAGIIAALFGLLYNQVIDPGYMESQFEAMREGLEERGLSDEQIEQQMTFMNMLLNNPVLTVAFTIVWTAILGLLKALIAGAILKKEAVTA